MQVGRLSGADEYAGWWVEFPVSSRPSAVSLFLARSSLDALALTGACGGGRMCVCVCVLVCVGVWVCVCVWVGVSKLLWTSTHSTE